MKLIKMVRESDGDKRDVKEEDVKLYLSYGYKVDDNSK